MDWWRSLVENTEASSVVGAAAAVLGGLFDSVFGAKIQADGGRAQAEAAREAATIATEAQRVAALWTVRQTQVAELSRDANALVRLCDRMWAEDGGDLPAQVNAASEALSLRWNELCLIVTENVVEAAGQLARSAMSVEEDAQRFAPVMHARTRLDRLTLDRV